MIPGKWSLLNFLKIFRQNRQPAAGIQDAHAALKIVEEIYRISGLMIIVRSPLRISLGGGGTDLAFLLSRSQWFFDCGSD